MAFTHASCARTHIESNERLEFLGDSILGLVVSDLLYNCNPPLPEGELSHIKSIVVSRKSCCLIAKQLELPQFILLGKGVVTLPDSIISNVLEAVIGALFLDGGYEIARAFIIRVFRPTIDAFFSNDASTQNHTPPCDVLDEDFKSRLQILVAKRFPGIQPEYSIVEEKGPPHSRLFQALVKVNSHKYLGVWRTTKRDAEQSAAQQAYQSLEKQD